MWMDRINMLEGRGAERTTPLRDHLFGAPHSAASRCFNRDGESASAKRGGGGAPGRSRRYTARSSCPTCLGGRKVKAMS